MVQTQRAGRERREVDFRPIDGDGHIVEPKAKLLEYLEMPYQEHYNTGSGLGRPGPSRRLEPQPLRSPATREPRRQD